MSDSVESAESCTYIHCWDHYNNRRDSHAGHFLYQFSRTLDRLEFDPAYPREPKTLGEYIRRRRMEEGISQASLASRLGVNEMTVVNWETRGMVPRIGSIREKLREGIPGVGNFFAEAELGLYKIKAQ